MDSCDVIRIISIFHNLRLISVTLNIADSMELQIIDACSALIITLECQ